MQPKNKKVLQFGAVVTFIGIMLSLFMCGWFFVAIWQFVSLLWIMAVEKVWDFNKILLQDNTELRANLKHLRDKHIHGK